MRKAIFLHFFQLWIENKGFNESLMSKLISVLFKDMNREGKEINITHALPSHIQSLTKSYFPTVSKIPNP